MRHILGTLIMTNCKHAETMIEYAKDALVNEKPWELWERSVIQRAGLYTNGVAEWIDLNGHPSWLPNAEYRRKVMTIKVNGFNIPKPVDCPKLGTKYYIPVITVRPGVNEYTWECSKGDLSLLYLRVVHLDSQAALSHSVAMASATPIPIPPANRILKY